MTKRKYVILELPYDHAFPEQATYGSYSIIGPFDSVKEAERARDELGWDPPYDHELILPLESVEESLGEKITGKTAEEWGRDEDLQQAKKEFRRLNPPCILCE